jgi:hypothetical protein
MSYSVAEKTFTALNGLDTRNVPGGDGRARAMIARRLRVDRRAAND